MTSQPYPAALLARRRAGLEARTALADDRWRRFQTASRRRYRGLARGLPRAARVLLARGKPPGRAMLIAASGLWMGDVPEGLGSDGQTPCGLWRYALAGPSPDVQPHALFDQRWYLAQAPGLAATSWPPLAHYLIEGDRQGFPPHPLFDPALADRTARQPLRGQTALHRFLAQGAASGANPHPLFDTRFYVGACEAVARSGENPLIHYLRKGWREGLNPHPLFDGDWYLATHPQARVAGVAPLLHYVTKGAAEGLDPHPLFNTRRYLAQSDGRAPAADPLSDFVLTGARALRSPNELFHPAYYLHRARQAPGALENPLLHYLTVGAFEGLWPAPDFDEQAYVAGHPQIADTVPALDHWARQGAERPDFKALAPPRGASIPALYAHYSQAAWPEPVMDEVAAYAQQRAAIRQAAPWLATADWTSAPQVLAFRSLRTPDWRAVLRQGRRVPANGLEKPGAGVALERDERLAARYGVTLVHEVADAGDADLISAARQPFALAWTGETVQPEVIKALLASPLAMRVRGRPILVVNEDSAAWRKAGAFLIIRGNAGGDAVLTAIGPSALAPAPDTFPQVVAGTGSRPGQFQAWLEAALARATLDRPEGERLVFVDSWNGWEQQTAIAPDLKFGHGWLEAVSNALDADLLAT